MSLSLCPSSCPWRAPAPPLAVWHGHRATPAHHGGRSPIHPGGPRFQQFDSLAFWLLLLILGLILSTVGSRRGKPPPAGFAAWLPLAGRLLQLGYSLQGQNVRCFLWGPAGSTSTFPGHRICSDLLDDNHGRALRSFPPSQALPCSPGAISDVIPLRTLENGDHSFLSLPAGQPQRAAALGEGSKVPSPFLCVLLRVENTSSGSKP